MPSFFPLPHIEQSPRRVRLYFGGVCLIDTKSAKFVWQTKYYPLYFFVEQDLPKAYLKAVEETAEKVVYDVAIGGKTAPGSLTLHRSGDLKGLFTIKFSSMDHWFEEGEEIFVHPKDPYKRVDVLQSSRNVRVEINGVEVANTRAPRFLYETMLPTRTYIPKVDCRLDLLEESQLTTQCPYKGEANYYHVKLPSQEKFENVVWWYRSPLPECGAVKGYLSFYDEKVDVFIDGEKQPRPVRD
ncbi:hypothetical protein AX17_006430 [Amanita inopinata Kibby_2008]|nr:hypothetical protein AX17_006430 [Amanita inopinata Kibby_2008]